MTIYAQDGIEVRENSGLLYIKAWGQLILLTPEELADIAKAVEEHRHKQEAEEDRHV